MTESVGDPGRQQVVGNAEAPVFVCNAIAGPLLNGCTVDGLTTRVKAEAANPVDQMNFRGGDQVDSPLLSGAAIAGRLNDCVSLVARSVDRLETLAVCGANQLDKWRPRPGPVSQPSKQQQLRLLW
jgi:poly(3-hydroxybutyrate) depolymerase